MLSPALDTALKSLADRAGDNLSAIIFFGSRLLNTTPGKHSAADWFIVVDDYAEFYRHFADLVSYPSGFVAWLNRILPPNAIYLPVEDSAGIKVMIISERDFDRAMNKRARDHFCQGRLVQKVAIIFARNEQARTSTRSYLQAARDGTLDWVPLYAGDKFTVESYCRAMMQTSYGAEIRPESTGRVLEVIAQQQASLIETFQPVLDTGVERGVLERDGLSYRLKIPASFGQRWRWRWYFRKSKVRATLRWFKYVMTFAGWPDYIARKLERRSGIEIELTDAERRWPLLLLWPKIIKYFVRLQKSKKSKP